MAITLQYDGPLQPLIHWIMRQSGEANELPTHFRNWVEAYFPAGYTFEYWQAGVVAGDGSDDWVGGFPHVHNQTMGWGTDDMSMMVYVQAPNAGGQSAIGGTDPNDPYEILEITPGLAIVVDGDTYHGVKPVTSGLRLAIIIGAHPPND